MYAPEDFDDSEGTVFRDLILLTLLGFVMMVILMIPHLNPPAAEADINAAGNVVIEARWDDDLPNDVDLWVQGPGDAPVGYSRKSGGVFDLLRDDLGRAGDTTRLNYEFAFSRGAPAGEYTVNLHHFNRNSGPETVQVHVNVSRRHPQSGAMTKIADRDVTLQHAGEELTVVRFRLDGDANLVTGSLHALPRNLRSSGG